MWTTTQVILGVISLILVFVGERLSIPFLTYFGIGCLGLTSAAIGWEAIFTRHIVIGRRRHGSRETYTGLAAVLQGVEFNLIGLFLIGIAFMLYQNISPRGLGIQIAHHPGLLLLLVGLLCLIHSVITFIGPLNSRDSSCLVETMGFLASRLLPGIVLVVIGLALTSLGLFEIVAPNAFDQIGGSLLEGLYGLR